MRSVAVGLGCRKDTPPQSIVALVREALARLPEAPGDVRLYSSERKSQEPGLREAATALGYSLVFLSDVDLSAVKARIVTRSAKVREVTGLDSVAEAAALAGGGARTEIVVPRLTSAGAACAIAAEISGSGDSA
jgi:cobalt-precorrin 5A hydrolase